MFVVQQDILSDPQYPRCLTVQQVTANDAARQFTTRLSEPGIEDIVPVGIACHISSKGEADFMCLAQPNVAEILLISLQKSKFDSISDFLCANGGSRHPLASKVCLVGFGMAQIAIQISHATNLRVKGVDLLTLLFQERSPSEFIAKTVDNKVKKSAVQRLWMGSKASAKKDVVLRAWLAACAGDRCKAKAINATRLDTGNLGSSELTCLAQLVAQSHLLEKIKPRQVQNDFSSASIDKEGKFQILNARFKTRVRRSNQSRVVMTGMNNQRFEGTATRAKGKTTTIDLRKGEVPSVNLLSVKVVGLPEPTNSERTRDDLVYLLLTGQKSLRESSFIQKLWFPDIVGQTASRTVKLENVSSPMKLNDSQCTAMRAMVGKSPIVIVHGPPGTGKTTTITAAAQVWDSQKFTVWIVAHSNVAVKNIAEKLFDKEVNFKILVSKEFHEEWHEHMYLPIEEKLVRSDELPDDRVGMERLILNSKVILCTLSMMLNPKLHGNGTFDIVPPRCLVVDEASQINAFEFMPVFDAFRKSIEKVCFFGDPWQRPLFSFATSWMLMFLIVPPFGQDDVPKMKTIFDFKHLNGKKDTYFLNTQYRMPNPIARFISNKVYGGRLRSKHDIDNPHCLAFIDVPRPGEVKAGTSSKNLGEVATVVHLVKYYYSKLEFCIITPYDAQRAAIQKGLEAENLPCGTVYNVDSFQGNEANYVIVSLVRSSRPGFLRSVRRMNVLLTRCRRGLIIVSSQAFLGQGGKGSDTLLGELVQHWQNQYSRTWIDWRSVADASADLPGATFSLLNTSSGSRPPGNAELQHKPSSMRDPALDNVITAQGQKSSQKAMASNVASEKQQQTIRQQKKSKKDPKRQPANSRNATKPQGT